MKIKKLEKDSRGLYDLAEVPDKINEIIELLNNSFISHDPYTPILDVTDSTYSVASVSCDRLVPLTNETTADIMTEHLLDMTKGIGIYDRIKCPKCGAKYFEVGPSCCTAVYYPPIIKDGVNINPNHNKSVTTYTCCECGHRWEQ